MAILYASDNNKQPVKASLVSQRTQGATTITLDSLEGWRKNERVPFIMVEKDLTTGKYKPGTQTSWTGVVSDSANTITALELTGGNEQMYPTGSVVIATPTSQWANDLVDALLVNLNTDGTLKDRVIKNRNIDDGTIEGVKIKDKTLTVDKVDWTTMTYKSDETVVGTWIDGKKIYRKMLQFNVTQAANQRHVYFNTTDFTFIDNVVKVEGFFKNDTGTSYPYGTYHMNVDGSVAASFAAFYEKSSKKLTITSRCDFSRNSAPMILAIHYTRV